VIAAVRALVIAIAIAGALLDALALTGTARQAHLGIGTAATLDWQHLQPLLEVVPGSGAERAGLRAGDRVRFASATDAQIMRLGQRGSGVHLVRADGRIVTGTLEPLPLALHSIVLLVQGILMSGLVVLLAVRAWTDPQAQRLAIGFLFTAYLSAGVVVVEAGVDNVIAIATDTLLGIGMASLVFFATGWSATPATRVRPLRWAAAAIACVYIVVSLAGDAGPSQNRFLRDASIVSWLLLTVLMIAGLALSFARARGTERRRIGWILATLTAAFAPWVVYETFVAAGAAAQLWTWVALSTLALPFGFGYAMLRHRLVDLGFALNRAAVFAATTALLVGLFGALQWGADQLLVRATGTQDFVIQMTIAVIVLYAVRSLRTRTDALVAHLFFAARQRRIDAIRALATEVDALEDFAAVAPLVTARLNAEAGIGAAVEFDGAAGSGVAFPLTVRGRSRGALVCVPPPDDADFAPDERDALTLLAGHVAIAYRLLERSVHASGEAVLATAAGSAE
jgi:hypothetical protein